MIVSDTTACFEASHCGEYADEIHGHLWWVRIYWLGEPRVNVETMNERLVSCLNQWDHKLLDGLVDPTNEGVAEAVAKQIAGLSQVKVWREGRLHCGARWINQKEKEVGTEAPHSMHIEMERRD